MATKKTKSTSDSKPASKGKAATKAKAKTKKAPARGKKAAAEKASVATGPLARLKAKYGSKESLIGKLVEPLAAADEDTDMLKDRLLKASNQQLLRLAKVVETVTSKYGGRDQLIAAAGKVMGKAKDSDFIARLGRMSLPRLYDLVSGAERRARRAA